MPNHMIHRQIWPDDLILDRVFGRDYLIALGGRLGQKPFA
jgi:hypothetical protein